MAPIYFTYPHMPKGYPKTLIIDSGANEITWDYTLNEQTIPTYGGEVVQLLSCRVTDIYVTGSTAFNEAVKTRVGQDELQTMGLEDIRNWFETYMLVMSGQDQKGNFDRDVTPIKLTYPAREWSFLIQVQSFDEFGLGTMRNGTEWGIRAQIVPEHPPRVLEDSTRMAFGMDYNTMFRSVAPGIGYIPDWKYSGPTNGSNSDLGAFAKTIGTNFQHMVAAWQAGDFGRFTYDVTGLRGNDWKNSTAGYYASVYGSSWLVHNKNSNSTASNLVENPALAHLSGTLTGEEVAAIAVQGGFPRDAGILTTAVAVAYAESRWSVGATNHNPDGSTDRGLWQINSVHHEYNAQRLLTDPVYNAQAAYAISHQGTDFQAWVTYAGTDYKGSDGTWRNYEPMAKTAVHNFLSAAAGGGGALPLQPMGNIIGRPYQGTHNHPSTGDRMHNWESCNAIDIATPIGTPVIAVADGVIGPQIGAFTGTTDPHLEGLRLHLNGASNQWYYAHLSRITVRAGQTVRTGDRLGFSGEAAGVQHLHFAQQHGDPGALVGSPSAGYSDQHYPA